MHGESNTKFMKSVTVFNYRKCYYGDHIKDDDIGKQTYVARLREFRNVYKIIIRTLNGI